MVLASSCTILVGEVNSVISGTFPIDAVREITSYRVEGYQFTPRFRDGHWDGRKHLFNKRLSAFPTGLLDDVIDYIKTAYPTIDLEVKWAGKPIPEPKNLGFDLQSIEFGKGKYDYQLGAAIAMIEKRRGIIKIATNGGKSEIACAVTKHIGHPTLFLVERKELLYQTRRRFSERLGIAEAEIGIVGDGNCVVKDITIASPQSYLNRLEEGKVPTDWTVLFGDECQHLPGDTYYSVVSQITAPYRYALSGTPLNRADGADLKLIAQTGPVIFEVRNKLLVERGISVMPSVEMLPIKEPSILKKMSYAQVEKLGIRENKQLNDLVVDNAIKHAKNKKQVLILVDKTSHGETIKKLLDGKKTSPMFLFIHGKENTETRLQALEDYKSGKIRILIATPILDEGINLPCIDVLILAAGGKSKIKLLQRVGRGLRSGKGKENLLVIDFANFTHKYLLKHSLTRLQTYEDEDCFVISG